MDAAENVNDNNGKIRRMAKKFKVRREVRRGCVAGS
jgi:hypothetical protein